MTIKDKLKSYNFWITLVSAIILLLQIFGEKFNFKVDSNFIIDVTTALCSIFVILGIISVPKSKQAKTEIQILSPDYSEICKTISEDISVKLYNIISEIKTENNVINSEFTESQNFETENNENADRDIINSIDAEPSKIDADTYQPTENIQIQERDIKIENDNLENSLIISDSNNPNN